MSGPDREKFLRVRSPFEGAVTRLRAVEESDLEWINANFWNPNVTRFLLVVWPEPIEGTRAFWERHRGEADDVAFLIEAHDHTPLGVGSLEGIQRRARTAELGLWLAEPFWGQGYGTDAVRAMCRFGFGEMNLARIALRVYDINPRAARAYEKVGFREEGRLRSDQFVDGNQRDAIVMGLLAGELIEPESEPEPR
jgi:RimJ/RimL family protein N-acetyltransferase